MLLVSYCLPCARICSFLHNADRGLLEKAGAVEQIPTKKCLFVLVDTNAWTGRRVDRYGDRRVLGAYGRDELNNNGKRLLSLASDNKLALTNTFFSARKGGLSHTFNGIINCNERKRIDYIVTRKAHRPRAYDAKVHPSLRLQLRRIQAITSYTRWSASAVVLRPTDAYVQKTTDRFCRVRVISVGYWICYRTGG